MILRTFMVIPVLALALATLPTAALASPEAEVRAAFDRFVTAQNAHDAGAVSALISDSPSFLWITRGTPVFGRADAMTRFQALYGGTWSLAPVGEVRITLLAPTVAQLYAPIDFTIGAAGATPAVTRFLMNQTWVKSGSNWVLANILPIAVPPAAPAPASTK